jgi:hypothetical protein
MTNTRKRDLAAEPSGVENGRPYDAYCIECGASVVWRNGAWICPRHRDLGHVEFVERIGPMTDTGEGDTHE